MRYRQLLEDLSEASDHIGDTQVDLASLFPRLAELDQAPSWLVSWVDSTIEKQIREAASELEACAEELRTALEEAKE